MSRNGEVSDIVRQKDRSMGSGGEPARHVFELSSGSAWRGASAPPVASPISPSADELAELGVGRGEKPTLYRANGCPDCTHSGYAGRVALYEVMMVDGKVRRALDSSTEEIFAAAVEQGMRTMRDEGARLVVDGVSSFDEIRRVTGDRVG
jgi:type II secretory ATPase GspE/PulE/Tfp pilus assembly ATPase PilB-like protein